MIEIKKLQSSYGKIKCVALIPAQNAGVVSNLSSRQLGIWIAIGIVALILFVVMLTLVWRFRKRICCGRSADNNYNMSMDNIVSSSSSMSLALDTTQRSSYIPDLDIRKNSVTSMDQPPSYNSFLAQNSKEWTAIFSSSSNQRWHQCRNFGNSVLQVKRNWLNVRIQSEQWLFAPQVAGCGFKASKNKDEESAWVIL